MMSYIENTQDNTVIPLIGCLTYSTGDGLEVKQRYGYDYSHSPQSLVYRKRNTALTATIQLSFTNTQCLDYGLDIMQYVANLEQICSKRVRLVWGDKNYGEFIVTSVQFSSQVDPMVILPVVSVSLALTEGFVPKKTLYTKVGTMVKPE